MRYVKGICASCVVSGLLIAGSVAAAADGGQDNGSNAPAAPAAPAAQPTTAPELRPGEIVIKPTGRKRVVLASPRATSGPATLGAPTTRPATRGAAGPVTDAADELAYEGPGPRVVTIGYFYREPGETGYGPRIHWPVYTSNCGYYGYTGYSGYGYGGYGYGGYGYGGYSSYRSCSPLLFGTPSYCTPGITITRCRVGR